MFAGFVDATGGGGWGPVATPALLADGRLEPRKVIGTVDTSEFAVSAAASIGFLIGLGAAGINWGFALALLIGGLIAAPLAAYLVRFAPAHLLGVAVGGIILLTNARTLLGSSRSPTRSGSRVYGAILLVTVIGLSSRSSGLRARKRGRCRGRRRVRPRFDLTRRLRQSRGRNGVSTVSENFAMAVPAPPLGQAQFDGVGGVDGEDLLHLPGHVGVEHLDVDLVVAEQAEPVDVRRADGRPLPVDGGRLGVHHGFLVEEQPYAAAQQLPVVAAGQPVGDDVVRLAGTMIRTSTPRRAARIKADNMSTSGMKYAWVR